MLTGRFGQTTGRPYFEGRIVLPRLKLSGNISFLVDTGTDTSVLMPSDGLRLGIPYGSLRGANIVSGIGGSVNCFEERAIFVFTEPGVAAYAYDLQIDIMPDDPSCMDCPSLLGRDVLQHWRLTHDPTKSILRALVRSADATFALKRTKPLP